MGSKNSDWLPRHLVYSSLFNAAGRQSSHYFDFKKHSEVEGPLYSGKRNLEYNTAQWFHTERKVVADSSWPGH